MAGRYAACRETGRRVERHAVVQQEKIRASRRRRASRRASRHAGWQAAGEESKEERKIETGQKEKKAGSQGDRQMGKKVEKKGAYVVDKLESWWTGR